MNNSKKRIPQSTISRLSVYLREVTELAKHNIKSISSFRWNNNWNGSDGDFSSEPVLTADWTDTTRQFTQEFRLISPLYEFFDYVAGLYYLYQNIDRNATLSAGPDFLVPNAEVFCKGIVIGHSMGGYVNTNLHLLQNLTLNGGLRYTYEKRTAEFNSKNFPEPIFYIDVENYTDTYSEGELSPKIGLNYSLSPNVFLYGCVAQGFTSGGWNLYFINTLERIKYMPEYATSFELGVKSNWFNNRVIANLSGFHTKFRDFQVVQYFETEEGVWENSRTNAGKVTTKGFELDISVLLIKELTISGGWVMLMLGLMNSKMPEMRVSIMMVTDFRGLRKTNIIYRLNINNLLVIWVAYYFLESLFTRVITFAWRAMI